MIKYYSAPDIEDKTKQIASKLSLLHIDFDRVSCIRSIGSKSRRTIARCHAMSRIFQIALNMKSQYVIEVISENFDKLSEEEKTKTLIHELCLPHEEMIVIKTAKGLEIIDIGTLVEKEFTISKNSKNSKRFGICKWVNPSEPIETLSYNVAKKKIEFSSITKLMMIPNRTKKVLSIITKDGRKIDVTPEHQMLYTKNPDSYDHPGRDVSVMMCKAKELGELKGIPRLLTLFKLPEIDRQIREIDIFDIENSKKHFSSIFGTDCRGEVIKMESKIKRFWVRGPALPTKFKLDKKFGQFFGLYLSEGSIDHKSGAVSFSFNTKEIAYQQLIKDILLERFNVNPKERITKNKCKIIYANSRLLQVVIKDIFGFGEKARYKKIPQFVYSSPLEFIAGIIDGWFAGDGAVSFDHNNAVTLSAFSKSQHLIFGMLLLLAKLGIVARLRREMQDILIQSFFVPKFYHHCRLLIKSKNLEEKVLKIRRMKHENMFRELKYIKLRSIQTKKYMGKYFYNLEVENNNNFMHASGIFTHNCHIPKSLGGGFRHHDFVNRRTVDQLYQRYYK